MVGEVGGGETGFHSYSVSESAFVYVSSVSESVIGGECWETRETVPLEVRLLEISLRPAASATHARAPWLLHHLPWTATSRQS